MGKDHLNGMSDGDIMSKYMLGEVKPSCSFPCCKESWINNNCEPRCSEIDIEGNCLFEVCEGPFRGPPNPSACNFRGAGFGRACCRIPQGDGRKCWVWESCR